MPIHLEIVTPERRAFEGDVDEVSVPGTEGELGILPHHAPLVSLLGQGVLRYRQGDKSEEFAIFGGFLQVRPDRSWSSGRDRGPGFGDRRGAGREGPPRGRTAARRARTMPPIWSPAAGAPASPDPLPRRRARPAHLRPRRARRRSGGPPGEARKTSRARSRWPTPDRSSGSTSPSPWPVRSFRIEGGRRLEGSVTISGAKNAALKLMAAATLTGERCRFDQRPGDRGRARAGRGPPRHRRHRGSPRARTSTRSRRATWTGSSCRWKPRPRCGPASSCSARCSPASGG